MFSYKYMFMNKVNKTGTCWLWTGAKQSQGYGRMRYEGGYCLAHRLSFVLHNGYFPKFVLHSCDVKLCVNPEHLRDGTAIENARDYQERRCRA